jgi:hypothetical protein
MAKFTVMVTECYCKALTIEACDAETAEALVRGQWDQGEHDVSRQDGTFDHVEFEAEEQGHPGTCPTEGKDADRRENEHFSLDLSILI